MNTTLTTLCFCKIIYITFYTTFHSQNFHIKLDNTVGNVKL